MNFIVKMMDNKKELSLYQKVIHSFDNQPGGFSARKLSAFVAVMTAVCATYQFVDNTTIVSALMIWLTFALLCLGIITAEQVLRFKEKNGNKEKQEDPQL